MLRPTIHQLGQRLIAAAQHSFAATPTERRRADALDLLAWAANYLPNHFTRPPSAMHRWLSDQLGHFPHQRGVKLNLIGPRGGAKSTVGTLAYVLRAAVERSEPYIWIVCDTKDQARAHLEHLQAELEENSRLSAAYPGAVGRGPQWRRSVIELRNGVRIEAYGAGQRLRGRRHRQHRPTLIVCDDLQNDSHIVSAYQRAASRDWFHGALLKAGSPTTNIVNLATALHRDALAMELLDAPGWIARRFAAITAWPTNTELWRQWEQIYCQPDNPRAANEARSFYLANQKELDTGAEVLWPEVEDLYTLMRMRCESGATAFMREKQGEPVDYERCEFPEYYFGEKLWFDEWPAELPVRTMAIDPSKGADARTGDFSAIVMLGIDPHGVLYIDADLARRPTPQLVADGVRWARVFRPELFGVETNQWQQLLSGEFLAEFHRQGLFSLAPCEITNHVSKVVRIRRLSPHLAMSRLRFKRGSPGAALLVDQLRDFPLGAHDDGPDALEMAVRLAEEHCLSAKHDDGLGERLWM